MMTMMLLGCSHVVADNQTRTLIVDPLEVDIPQLSCHLCSSSSRSLPTIAMNCVARISMFDIEHLVALLLVPEPLFVAILAKVSTCLRCPLLPSIAHNCTVLPSIVSRLTHNCCQWNNENWVYVCISSKHSWTQKVDYINDDDNDDEDYAGYVSNDTGKSW